RAGPRPRSRRACDGPFVPASIQLVLPWSRPADPRSPAARSSRPPIPVLREPPPPLLRPRLDDPAEAVAVVLFVRPVGHAREAGVHLRLEADGARVEVGDVGEDSARVLAVGGEGPEGDGAALADADERVLLVDLAGVLRHRLAHLREPHGLRVGLRARGVVRAFEAARATVLRWRAER